MKDKKRQKVTQYGEFVPSFHAWIGLDKQKEIAERLEKVGKNKENE